MIAPSAPRQTPRGETRPGRPAAALRGRLMVPALMLAGVVVVALAWQLLDRGKDRSSAPAPATRVLLEPRLGLRVGYPPSWTVERKGPARRLRSPDSSISIIFTSPTAGSFARQVRRDTERALLAGYRPARIVGRAPGWVGSRRVQTTEIVGTDRHHQRIRILSIAAASRWRTYAIAVFSAIPPRANRFLEAQQILRSVSFVRPSKHR